MFGNRWRLFRLLGIPINLDASWIIILVLIAWSLGAQFSSQFQNENVIVNPASPWIMGVVAALVFFVCIVLHELGHAETSSRLWIWRIHLCHGGNGQGPDSCGY